MNRPQRVTPNKLPPKYLAFLDECGDHSLTRIDQDFPLFVLSLVIVTRENYFQHILPGMNRLKLAYWNHEGVNLHSRDIRKAMGPFTFLQNPGRRNDFMNSLSKLMDILPYELFIVGIRKDRLCNRYVHASNPYELALTYLMERVLFAMQQRNQISLPIIAEARGSNEDNQLKAAFFDLLIHGTEYVSKERFQQCHFELEFHNKKKNIAGIQLADLCAHPAARQIIRPAQLNRAFDIIKEHIYSGTGKLRGWKVFP
jgi:hypothetical protein